MLTGQSSILCAVDGSEQSLEAVRYVSRLLPPDRTRVTLFHVTNLIPDAFWDFEADPRLTRRLKDFHRWKGSQRDRMEEFMGQAKQLLRNAGYPVGRLHTRIQDRKGGIARDILAEAKQGYSALVVARRGKGQLQGLILGSTTTKLVNHAAKIPLWVIGERPDPGKILLAMDNSNSAVRMLDYVSNYLGLLNKELLLFHVIRELEQPLPQGAPGPQPRKSRQWLDRLRQEVIASEREIVLSMFERRIRQLAGKGADTTRIKTKIVTGIASRAGGVLQEARRGGYGTIVLGRKGLSRVEGFVMGRVTNKVLQLARDNAVWVVN